MRQRMRIFSGIQPTAVITIGNYFGAVRNWVGLQDEAECVYCVVDLHAMTVPYEADRLRRSTREMLLGLLAAGLDPEKSVVCVQSTVPEHTELCWILATLASIGDLGRMTQFKEKSQLLKGSENESAFVSSGLLFYPVLQAADILAYRTDAVPVGRDQSQHLELSRRLARRFNSRFGKVFPEPRTLHTPVQKVLSTADPARKMSKSLGPKHYIGLFEEEETVRAKIKTAVTDSGPGGELSPGVGNLLAILAACGCGETANEMREEYAKGTLRYVRLKTETADALAGLTHRMRERREEVRMRIGDIDELIAEMSARARNLTKPTLNRVRERAGLA